MATQRQRVSEQNGLDFFVEGPDHKMRRATFSRGKVVWNEEFKEYYQFFSSSSLEENEQVFEAWVENR